jgi:4-hydroxy-4-methyl-2-oxoglutarate aldolase
VARLTAPASLLARLAALDSCACSDAMDQLGLTGVADGLRGLTVARRVTGPVITVQLGPPDGSAPDGSAPDGSASDGSAPAGGGGASSRPGRHLGTAAIDAAQPGDVIVVAAGGRTDAAGWGGILSLAAVTRQVGGVIVDGACRDVDESSELGLPVYALAATPRTARGRQAEVAWDVSVLVAGIRVDPGDLVIADGSGVVFLPASRADEIIAAAERIAAREAAMASRVRAGEPASQVMSADYEELLKPQPDRP